MSDVALVVHEESFLATTALEEFWDTSKPLLFLGEWCLLYGRRSFWQPLKGELLESPFGSGDAARAAYEYVNNIYERILPHLGDALNSIHGENYSHRYWRIVIGPWLQLYLSVIYDRYLHIKQALEKCPNLTTITLSDSSFVVPNDTLEFASYLKTDAFNLQIYTRILTVLGHTFPCKDIQTEQRRLNDSPSLGTLKSDLRRWVEKLYSGITAKLPQSIFLKDSYFSRKSELQFLLRTLGNVRPFLGRLNVQSDVKFNGEIRKKLQNNFFKKNDFEQCVSAMLFVDIPKCFVENFSGVGRAALNFYPNSPQTIFSANSWYYEEIFKQWAAKSAEKGTLLIGTPHGGSYGGLLNMPSEDHETAIVDRYYSWGWMRTNCAAEVIPFFASKLTGRKKINASNLKKGILWAATAPSRYLVQFPLLSKFSCDYIAWQSRFARALDMQLVSIVRLRPHREDDGWGITPRIKECVPSIGIETWDIPFQESLANCRLYVCDHFSTTFAEALAANKPTILFWDNQANELRSEAQPYYDLLRKVGILFDSPELAGEAVNQIYDDVEGWWNDSERKDAVSIFCEQFARNSPDAIKLWVDEFKRIDAMLELKSASLTS